MSQPIDERALLRYCRRHVSGFPKRCASIDVEQFAHGQSNPTYKIAAMTSAGEVCGCTSFGKSHRVRSEVCARRRTRVRRHARAGRHECPCLKAPLCEDATVGESFYIMSLRRRRHSSPNREWKRAVRRDGRRCTERWRRRWGRYTRWTPQPGLGNFGKPERYSERQLERWAKQYEASVGPNVGVSVESSMVDLIAWLRANAPKREIRRLARRFSFG